jgi:hypothetical protein
VSRLAVNTSLLMIILQVPSDLVGMDYTPETNSNREDED